MQPKDESKQESKPMLGRLKELFWQNPFRNSVSLLTLLLAIALTLVLVSMQNSLMIIAFVHLLPLVIVITDSVRDKLAGKSPRWPAWLVIVVYGVVFIGSMGVYIEIYGNWEEATLIYFTTFIFSLLAVFVTLLPRLLSYLVEKLATATYVGAYIKKVDTPENLYFLPLLVACLFLIFVAAFDGRFNVTIIITAAVIVLLFLPPLIWGKFLWKKIITAFLLGCCLISLYG